MPALLFALLHVERIVRLLEQAERLPAETIIRDEVATWPARVRSRRVLIAVLKRGGLAYRCGAWLGVRKGMPDILRAG